MGCASSWPINFLNLIVKFCVLQLCYELGSEFFSQCWSCNNVQQRGEVHYNWYPKHEILKNDHEDLVEQECSSVKMLPNYIYLKIHVEDLVRYNMCQNRGNPIFMIYPFECYEYPTISAQKLPDRLPHHDALQGRQRIRICRSEKIINFPKMELNNSFFDVLLNTAESDSLTTIDNSIIVQNMAQICNKALTTHGGNMTGVNQRKSKEDTKMVDVLYKQDVDLGYMFSSSELSVTYKPTTRNDQNEEAEKLEAIRSLKNTKLDEHQYQQDVDIGYLMQMDNASISSIEDTVSNKNIYKSETENLVDGTDDRWVGIPYKIDAETGEYIRLPPDDLFEDFLTNEGNCVTNSNLNKRASDSFSLQEGLDFKMQGVSNISNRALDGINADTLSHSNYHQNYLQKIAFHSLERNENCFQARFENLDSVGLLTQGPSLAGADINYTRQLSSNSADLAQTEGMSSSFFNDECIEMLDISGCQKPRSYSQDMVPCMENSCSMTQQTEDKSKATPMSLCGNSAPERLDLSCDSAVSSLESEPIPLTSDGEWGDGSDSGQEFHLYNYKYTGGDVYNRHFPVKQVPGVQKKYHMFGKRYVQENAPQSSMIQSTIQFLSSGSISTTESIESIINSTISACTSDLINTENIEKTNKIDDAHDKFGHDKSTNNSLYNFGENKSILHHNHTYSSLHNSSSYYRLVRENLKNKDGEQLTRDEKRARNFNVPIPVTDIINLPMDEFNECISKYDLTENQLSLIRDIRRRGKNKVAAQNCRKRKLDQILFLESEVKEVRRRKDKLFSDRDYISAEKRRIANKFATLHQHVFQFLKDSEGKACSPSKYSLHQAPDGSIYLLPRESTKSYAESHISLLFGIDDISNNVGYREK